MTRDAPSCPSRTVTSPVSVNLIALESKLVTICRTRPWSVFASPTLFETSQISLTSGLASTSGLTSVQAALDQIPDIETLWSDDPPGFDFGEVQQAVDEFKEAVGSLDD